jgi:outer membrane protein OmpA-like peptidoglycan-associated protein
MAAAPLRPRCSIPFVVALILGGCASSQRNVVVLLPEDGSTSSEVTVTNRGGAQVLSRPYEATEIASPGRSPKEPATLDQAAVQDLFGEALTAMPASPAHFVLYFEVASTELTAESRQLLPQIVEAATARSPAEVAVVGHTDTSGAADRNVRLGLERAETVAALLRSFGVVPASLETGSHGEAALLVPTGDEVAEPRNRRVEVTVR